MDRLWLVLFSTVHALLLAYSAWVHSPTYDEIPHVVSGLSHLQNGEFTLYRVNPPLARIVAALPVFLTESNQESWRPLYAFPGDFGRAEMSTAESFIALKEKEIFRWVLLSRLATSIFSVLGVWICYHWARSLYGSRAGLLAAFLWCFSPYVLAFGANVSPDVPSATVGACALYTFSKWLKDPSWVSCYNAGLALGLAELTKSTWIILPPLFVSLWLINRFFSYKDKKEKWRTESLRLVATFGIAWVLFIGGYGFQEICIPLKKYRFQSAILTGQLDGSIGNRFDATFLASVPVPLPKQYVLGFDYNLADTEPGKKYAYLRGELRQTGWWYYYLYAVCVKCTIGGLMLFFSAVGYRLATRGVLQSGELVVVGSIFVLLILLSVHSGMNKHTRYLLPVIPIAIVWSSQLATVELRKNARWAIYVFAAVSAISSLRAFPHSISYFNELIGGPTNGWRHLGSSNVDWGQDMFLLKKEMERQGWQRIGLASVSGVDPKLFGINYFLPPMHNKDALDAEVYVVSGCMIQGYPRNMHDGNGGYVLAKPFAFSYFRELEPTSMIGYSMFVFDRRAAQDDLGGK